MCARMPLLWMDWMILLMNLLWCVCRGSLVCHSFGRTAPSGVPESRCVSESCFGVLLVTVDSTIARLVRGKEQFWADFDSASWDWDHVLVLYIWIAHISYYYHLQIDTHTSRSSCTFNKFFSVFGFLLDMSCILDHSLVRCCSQHLQYANFNLCYTSE